jgi:hypothetical protein
VVAAGRCCLRARSAVNVGAKVSRSALLCWHLPALTLVLKCLRTFSLQIKSKLRIFNHRLQRPCLQEAYKASLVGSSMKRLSELSSQRNCTSPATSLVSHRKGVMYNPAEHCYRLETEASKPKRQKRVNLFINKAIAACPMCSANEILAIFQADVIRLLFMLSP